MDDQKTVMSSFDIKLMVEELTPLLVNRLVDNIYQIDSHTLSFALQGLDEKLLVEAGRRVHLTEYRHPIPKYPPLFCQGLRKYLRRMRLTSILQIDFDRLIELQFSGPNEVYYLYTELFGRGNHILVTETKRILHALTYRRMRARDIIRGAILVFPPSRKNILTIERFDLEILLGKNENLVKQLTRSFNIGQLYAEEILLRSELPLNTQCHVLTPTDLDTIYHATQSLLAACKGDQPHIVLNKQGGYQDVLPFLLMKYANSETLEYPSFSKAMDEYYMLLQTKQGQSAIDEKQNGQLRKQQRIIIQQRNQLENLEMNIQLNQRIGDLIHAHAYEIQQIIDRVMGARRSGTPWNPILDSINLQQTALLPKSIDPDSGAMAMEIDDISFKLDLRKNVYENAADFYTQTKTEKAKLDGLKKAMGQTNTRLLQIRTTPFTSETEQTPSKIRKRAWYEKFHWFYSTEELLVLGGRDATTNDILINRHMDSNDIVLHADIPGSPFAIIKTEGGSPSNTTLREAAQMVASYSKGWRTGLSALDVYWIRPEQVRKSPPSGEYLARGSFMIYGQRNYLRNMSLRLAIGVKVSDHEIQVIGGPPSAVAAHASSFAEIIPGRVKTGKLIRNIQSKLLRGVPDNVKSRIKRLPLDEFQVFIPGGRGELVKK
jgi:predicted ribosome quality control (RQC) complex YloA/Tae2 family protein